MRKYFYICFCLLSISILFAKQVTWTGNGGDSKWDNPANWDGGVPTDEDRVTIPQGNTVIAGNDVQVWYLDNAGTLVLNSKADGIINLRSDGIFNTGDIVADNPTGESAESNLFIQSSGEIVNKGTLASDQQLDISCFSLTNHGSIKGGNSQTWSGADISISTAGYFNNYGTIKPNEDETSTDIVILSGRRFRNDGTINCGSGQTGSLQIVARNCDGLGHILAGNVSSNNGIKNNVSFSTNQGPKPLRLMSSGFMQPPVIYSVWAENPDMVKNLSQTFTQEDHDTPVFISGDSVTIDQKIITFDTLVVYGKYIRFELDDQWEIWASAGLKIYTPPGGAVDFSGTHTADALGASVPTLIYADNIIAPAEGLDHIIDNGYQNMTPDSSFMAAQIFTTPAAASAGNTGSMKIYYQNQSSLPQTLQINISSGKNWVTETQENITDAQPFVQDSLDVAFSIPENAALADQDSVLITVSIKDSIMQTLKTYIHCDALAETNVADHSKETNAVLKNFKLSVYPNPTNSETRVLIDLTEKEDITLSVYNIRGQIMETFKLGLLSKGQFQYHLNGNSYPSGIYFIQAKGRHFQETKRLVLQK